MRIPTPLPGRASRGQSGQAAVESALTLPLVVFLFLGTLQLFLMLQGRILAQYAVSRAARAGSLNHGSCRAMEQAAIATLLPSFHSFLSPTFDRGRSAAEKYVHAFSRRRTNQFDPALDNGHDGAIVWLFRERPLRSVVRSRNWEEIFDLPASELAPATGASMPEPLMLELRMVYWFPLRIPFANWVLSRTMLVQFGLDSYRGANPLMVAQRDAGWVASPSGPRLLPSVADELRRRANLGQPQYVIPIETTYVTRMMTPPRNTEFPQQDCPQP